jgi:hypothetical protein
MEEGPHPSLMAGLHLSIWQFAVFLGIARNQGFVKGKGKKSLPERGVESVSSSY